MRQKSVNPDRLIARVAARQHGVVTIEQLVTAGVASSSVSRRVQAGRLHRVFRGVYAVGHAGLSSEGRWIAAVLACGEGAVLSHRSAAELWGMLEAHGPPVHVIARRSAGRKHRGLRAHRSPSLTLHETTSHRGIAVTTPARTLADLRHVESPGMVRKAIRQAEYLGLPLGEIQTDGTRSDLERAFLLLCRRYRLPAPEVNQRIGPYTVDFLWRDRRLVVETDGYATHRGRQAFEDDRARDSHLTALGYNVLRFTYHRLTCDAPAVAIAVRDLLG